MSNIIKRIKGVEIFFPPEPKATIQLGVFVWNSNHTFTKKTN